MNLDWASASHMTVARGVDLKSKATEARVKQGEEEGERHEAVGLGLTRGCVLVA